MSLVITPRETYGYEIVLDGVNIEDSVSAVGLSMVSGRSGIEVQATLSLVAGIRADLEFVDPKIALSRDDIKLLIKLGWTPPKEET